MFKGVHSITFGYSAMFFLVFPHLNDNKCGTLGTPGEQ